MGILDRDLEGMLILSYLAWIWAEHGTHDYAINYDCYIILRSDNLDSVAKVICHAQRSAKKKLLDKSPGSTCKKNPHVIVLVTEIKYNSSFFNNDANTTLLNDMNATQFHFDSSDSEEDLNSRRKKKRETLIKVTMNRGFAWRWLF